MRDSAMGKAKLGVLLAGAYAFGLAVLLVAGLSLPCGTLSWVRPTLASVPQRAHRVVQVVRVAIHAGGLGMKHLPDVLGPQGSATHKKAVRFCDRDAADTGCGSRLLLRPLRAVPAGLPVLVEVVLDTNPG